MKIVKMTEYKNTRVKEYYRNNKAIIFLVALVTYLTGFLAYYIFMQNGYGNGDAIIEGQWFYHNPYWHLSLGRWGVRYFNEWIGQNLVLPHIIVFLYCTIVIIVTFLLKSILKIDDFWSIISSAMILIVNPCVISQLSYRHVALTMAFSLLLSVLFIICELSEKIYVNTLGIVCTTLMLGLYQSYISVIAVLALECIIVRLLKTSEEWEIKKVLLFLLRCLVSGILGCGIYFLILKHEMNKWNVSGAERFNSSTVFSSGVKGTLQKIALAYRRFFYYYNETMLNRYVFYRILLFAVLVSVIVIMVSLIKHKNWGKLICISLAGILLPVAMDIVEIILDGTSMSNCGSFQYVLIIPFSFVIIEEGMNIISSSWDNLLTFMLGKALRTISIVAVFLLVFTYIINANATWRSYELSYNATKIQYQMMLERIYLLDGYELNETPILPIGRVSDKAVRSTHGEIYKYALDFPEYVYCWDGYQSVKDSRYFYFIDFMGIDPKFDPDSSATITYNNIINSKEFRNMPLWPAEGSVTMIDGVAVVKLTDDPPLE